MKLSTSNLGCFKWDLPTTLTQVREYGFDGIDFRGMHGEVKLWRTPEFSSALKETAARVRDSGLTVSCLSSGVRLTEQRPGRKEDVDEELGRAAEIAAALDCGQIRVFGGRLGEANGATEADRARIIEEAAARLCELAERARAAAEVELLVETHDDWTRSEHMQSLLEQAGRGDAGCCWDIKHTYWVAREVPETTWSRLSGWTRNTHWKDVHRHAPNPCPGDDGVKGMVGFHGVLCPVGEGVAPLKDALELLARDGYDGWYTLEWEKGWHKYIEEPEVAFPGFAAYMRGIEKELAARSRAAADGGEQP